MNSLDLLEKLDLRWLISQMHLRRLVHSFVAFHQWGRNRTTRCSAEGKWSWKVNSPLDFKWNQSVQASLSRPGFHDQTPLLHMGCIISPSPLRETAAVTADAPCCDKPPPSACVCTGYQLRGANNRMGRGLTYTRAKSSTAIMKEEQKHVSTLRLCNYSQSTLRRRFHENVTAITFNRAVKTKKSGGGVLFSSDTWRCTHQKTHRSHIPKCTTK